LENRGNENELLNYWEWNWGFLRVLKK
jgi:hypothetical protein